MLRQGCYNARIHITPGTLSSELGIAALYKAHNSVQCTRRYCDLCIDLPENQATELQLRMLSCTEEGYQDFPH